MTGTGARLRLTATALLLAASAAIATASPPEEPTALPAPDDWPSWGRSAGEQHYSPLDQIGLGNVGGLGLAWYYDLPPGNTATGPVAAAGKLFVTTGLSQIRAFDAATGRLLWEYDGAAGGTKGLAMRFGWGPKGIAYWEGKLFFATQDGRVIALDAATGKAVWEQRDYPQDELRYINGPPRVFDGKLIIGHGGADFSPIRGYVTAYDAASGKRLWRFHTVPGNPADGFENAAMAMAAKTWTGQWWKHGGGGSAWNAFSYDPELGLIYIGVGNGYPYNQAIRSPQGGDNLFLASIVAVRAATGEYVWHYQVCPGDQWDCTAVQDMSLATLEIGGKRRKVLTQAPKNGFFYVIDRATGEFISARPFAKVTWAKKIDPKSGRPVENPRIRYHGRKGMFEMWPGLRGAHSWMPQSYSPRTGLVYLPVIEGATMIGDEGIDLDNLPPIGAMGINADIDPGLPGARRGFLKAWDPVKQKPRWTVEVPGNWPGGTMATAGDLVFQGRVDGRFVAHDARTGKLVWSFEAASPVVAPPISYRVGGTQYVTVITGNGGGGGGIFSAGVARFGPDYRTPRRVLTFALGGTATLPDAGNRAARQAFADPGYAQDAALAMQGARAYEMGGCSLCHGMGAVPGGGAPDLRASPVVVDDVSFRAVVRDGAIAGTGMPAFPEITDANLTALRQYLRSLNPARRD